MFTSNKTSWMINPGGFFMRIRHVKTSTLGTSTLGTSTRKRIRCICIIVMHWGRPILNRWFNASPAKGVRKRPKRLQERLVSMVFEIPKIHFRNNCASFMQIFEQEIWDTKQEILWVDVVLHVTFFWWLLWFLMTPLESCPWNTSSWQLRERLLIARRTIQ